ncbi:MAG: ABC transporter permease [Roseiarcus sp.]|jgi:ribose transport system permease protein
MSKSALVAYAMIPTLFVLSMAMIPGFGSFSSVVSLLVIASLLGIASIGQTLTVILGGIDLSIPAIIGLANVLTVRWYGAGVSFALVVVLVVAIAMAIGALNGIVSRVLGAHPLLTTLAASFMILGGVLVYTEGQTVGTVPDYLLQAVSPAGRTGPIPLPPILIIWLFLTVLIVAIEQRSVLGRFLFASGASERAARMSLVPVTMVWAATFAVSAGCAAVAGVLLAGFSGGADASVGQPYLFQTVAAVVVGGTALLGGSGSYGRTFAGTLLITEITTLLIGLGFSDRIQQIMLGLLIIVLVAIYGREPHVRNQI